MWLGNYEIVELKGSSALDHSVMNYSTCLWMQGLWLAAIVSAFKIDPQWSWCSLVESCPLPKKSPTSWVMNGGHSSSQMPSWPLGHSCGIVSLKSVVPVIVLTNGLPSWWWQERHLPWQASLEVCSRSHCCSLGPAFYVPNSMRQIPLLLQTLRMVPVSWQDLCLIHIMLTTTLWGRYYYPLFTIWGNWGIRRLIISLPKVLFRKWQSWVSNSI